MGSKDLHNEPFDEGTLTKLGIFEDYADAWLPTFVMSGFSTVSIFDFFAGPGFDIVGVPGSPIRLLNIIKKHIGNIFKLRVRVEVHLNEFDPEKYRLLKIACGRYLEENPDVNRAAKVHLYNHDFGLLFPGLLPLIRKQPSLVFLDQNGIRFLSPKYLAELEKLKQTDFLCFLSASHIWRFGETDEFRKHLELDTDRLKQDGYKSVHRSIVKQLRSKLDPRSKLRLYPFSIQKGPNIYGLVFGASHPLAVEKFLDISWRVNNINGEANFDIDDEAGKRQGNLFEPTFTKIEAFEKTLISKVLSKDIVNNSQAYDFCHAEGHPGRHASNVLLEMKRNGGIAFEGKSPLVNYNQIHKNKRIVNFIVL